MKPIAVLLADDHRPTLEDVRATLSADERFTVCAAVPNAAQAVSNALRLRPDLCLLDIHMPGSGIAATWEITARLPETRVVMFTVSEDSTDLFAALRAGAVGYLLKDIDPARLGDALVAATAGEAAIPRMMVTRMVSHFRDRTPRRRELADAPLTSREWEVLELMAQGLSNTDIARTLVVSPITVRTHVAAVLRKLRVTDRESAVRLFQS